MMGEFWIKIHFEYKGQRVTLPVNPEDIVKDRRSGSQSAEVVGLGEIVIPLEPRLQTFPIKSFFWKQFIEQDSSATFRTVKEYVNWFTNWQNAKEPARFIAEAPLNYDILVICEGFKDTVKAGEEYDVYYELNLREYRPYGASIVKGNEKPGEQRADNKPVIESPYIVKAGDFLMKIAKAMTGDDGRWPELYAVPENKKVIGADPDVIEPGQKLIIPEEWRG